MDEIYAVLTGDVVASSRLKPEDRRAQLRGLKHICHNVEMVFHPSIRGNFHIFRGDSMQGVLAPPSVGVTAALALYAGMVRRAPEESAWKSSELRIAVGVGPVDHLDKKRTMEASGDAFLRSGLALDSMKGTQRIEIRTGLDTLDAEFRVECRLLDVLLLGWTAEQAEAVSLMLEGLTKEQTARKIGITQPAVTQRLRGAGWQGIQAFLNRCRTVLDPKK